MKKFNFNINKNLKKEQKRFGKFKNVSTNARKSVLEPLAKPSITERLDATYIKARTKKIFPENVDQTLVEYCNNLRDIGLTGCMWETYRVNALYDFSYQKLSHYERLLASQIENDASQIQPDFQYKPHYFEIKLEYFPEMIIHKKDNPPIKITVIIEDEEGLQLPCFTGLLLSVGRKPGFMEEERKVAEAIILPLLLVNYTKKIYLESVRYFLEDNFSCCVGPLMFSSYDLLWMLALFSSPDKDNCRRSTAIEYSVPSEELSSIEYIMDPNTITQAWKQCIVPSFTKEISEDQVYEFLSILEHHFYKMFSINLSYLQLHVIKTPLARVQADHSIIALESNKLYFVMRHLTHLAQEIAK